jgi:hypothetical protein
MRCRPERGPLSSGSRGIRGRIISETRGRQSFARYAVVFREGTNAPTAGGLVVGADGLRLLGRGRDGRVEVSIPYAELREVRIGRSREESLNGHPALVLARRTASPVQVGPLGAGLLHELADLLAALTTEHADDEVQVVVIVPLKAGCADRARALLEQGPPFDPAALGLTRHEVFVGDREAVFVFGGPQVREKIAHATHDPTLWRAGMAWRACIAGRPRLLDSRELPAAAVDALPVYTWAADDGRA